MLPLQESPTALPSIGTLLWQLTKEFGVPGVVAGIVSWVFAKFLGPGIKRKVDEHFDRRLETHRHELAMLGQVEHFRHQRALADYERFAEHKHITAANVYAKLLQMEIELSDLWPSFHELTSEDLSPERLTERFEKEKLSPETRASLLAKLAELREKEARVKKIVSEGGKPDHDSVGAVVFGEEELLRWLNGIRDELYLQAVIGLRDRGSDLYHENAIYMSPEAEKICQTLRNILHSAVMEVRHRDVEGFRQRQADFRGELEMLKDTLRADLSGSAKV